MMNNRHSYLSATVAAAAILIAQSAVADVEHRQVNSSNQITYVSDDPWQPEGFVNGTTVPATWLQAPDITIDGGDAEDAWSLTPEVEVPLYHGSVEHAWLKALYTDDEVFIRVRWADSTEDRQHHPWTWDAEQESYVAGSQIEDSVMLSFEAGCEWTPSLLGGYIYDFDAWHWLAARSDPLGQALDLYGNVQDRDTKLPDFVPYPSRVVEDDTILKFTENRDVSLYANWDGIDRVYMMQPVTKNLWVRAVPDGGRQAPEFVEKLPAPSSAPDDPSQIYPQFSPLKLTGSAAEVAASGQWKDGYWIVEFRRARETPVAHIYDTIFNRLVQFSVQVFDHAERLDQSSESGRLFLQFLQPEQRLANQ
jgi:hypothetical protein